MTMKMDLWNQSRFLDACSAGHLHEVKQLVRAHGAGLFSQKSTSGDAGIHRAAAQGHLEIVQFLVGSGQSLDEPGFNGTLLYNAAYEGRLEVVRYSLDAGANINAVCASGTPLMGSLYTQHHAVTKLLLERGALVSAMAGDDGEMRNVLVDEDGHDALYWVIANDNDVAFVEFAKCGFVDGETPLNRALILSYGDSHFSIPKIVTACLNDQALSGDMTAERLDTFISRSADPAVLAVLRSERTRLQVMAAIDDGCDGPSAASPSRRSVTMSL